MGFTFCHTPKSIMKLIEKDSNDCWLWKGHIDSKYGYGRILYQGKKYQAHRLFYTLFKGEIPSDLIVRHTCDIKCCVNPEHLLLGTNKQNSEDMVSRNRQYRPKGEKNKRSKLTQWEVYKIKKLIPHHSVSTLAKFYGVSSITIRRIKNGETWAD